LAANTEVLLLEGSLQPPGWSANTSNTFQSCWRRPGCPTTARWFDNQQDPALMC